MICSLDCERSLSGTMLPTVHTRSALEYNLLLKLAFILPMAAHYPRKPILYGRKIWWRRASHEIMSATNFSFSSQIEFTTTKMNSVQPLSCVCIIYLFLLSFHDFSYLLFMRVVSNLVVEKAAIPIFHLAASAKTVDECKNASDDMSIVSNPPSSSQLVVMHTSYKSMASL